MNRIKISRRKFLKNSLVAGGGLVLGFHFPMTNAANIDTSAKKINEINAWLSISPNGIVTVKTPQTEMGQGAFTSIPMMIAEELNVPWKNIRAEFADANFHVRTNNVYVTTSTGGSRTVRSRHPYIMQAGASARERLKQAAANTWGVSRNEIKAYQGTLSYKNKKGSYGEFAEIAANIKLNKEPDIKEPKDWWILGKNIPRIDVKVKTDGSAKYPIDIHLPNMVYAAVTACPVPGGMLKSFDFSVIKDLPGVLAAVELIPEKGKNGNRDLHSGVAVVADSWYRAKNALDIMPVKWDYGNGINISNSSQFKEAQQCLTAGGDLIEDKEGNPGYKVGEGINSNLVKSIITKSKKIVRGEYSRPFETHATMMPPSAVADVKKDRVDVWSFSQDTARSLLDASEQLKRDPKEIYFHQTFIGGGFGNGYCVDIVRQVVEISKQVQKPVKLIWSREEDICQDSQRPPFWAKYVASIGANGLPDSLLTHVVGEEKEPRYSTRGVVNMPYIIPNRRHEYSAVRSNIPVGPHRAPGSNSNSFFIEQMVDEVAIAGGWDPLDWRIKMTEGNEPWQRVLYAMKEKSGFRTDMPHGEGMGIAVFESHGSIAGACATVSISKRGHLFIEKVSMFVNSGYIINPLNAREQIESAVAFELGTALSGGLDIRKGQVNNTNFDTYSVLRMADMPDVEVHFTLSKNNWWGGIGEPGGPPVPPAVANAIFYAVGKRVRSTPFNKEALV